MSWIKIDDNFADHPKFVALSNDAVATWARALGYCNRHMTDGKIGLAAARLCTRLPRPDKAIAELVKVGLWEQTEDGFQFHDYHQWNESRATRERKLNDAKERKERWKEQKRNGGGTRSDGVLTASQKHPGTQTEHPAEAEAEAEAEAYIQISDREGEQAALAPASPSPPPCPKCDGTGRRVWPDTSCGRGGFAGQSLTEGPCSCTWPKPGDGPSSTPKATDGAKESPKPQDGTKAAEQSATRAERKRPATRQPADGIVGDWLHGWKIPPTNDPTWGSEVQKFLDWHAAKDSRFVDWGAAWRTWRAKAAEFGRGPSAHLPPRGSRPVQRSPEYQPTEERKRAEFLAENARKQRELGLVPDEFGQVF